MICIRAPRFRKSAPAAALRSILRCVNLRAFFGNIIHEFPEKGDASFPPHRTRARAGFPGLVRCIMRFPVRGQINHAILTFSNTLHDRLQQAELVGGIALRSHTDDKLSVKIERRICRIRNINVRNALLQVSVLNFLEYFTKIVQLALLIAADRQIGSDRRGFERKPVDFNLAVEVRLCKLIYNSSAAVQNPEVFPGLEIGKPLTFFHGNNYLIRNFLGNRNGLNIRQLCP